MKNSGFIKLSVAMLVAVVALFNFTSALAQEEPDRSMNKTIKIKMITKKGGNTKVFDTTLQRSGKLLEGEMMELMKELKVEMSDLSREMENLDLEIELQSMDSTRADSLENEIEKVIIRDHGKNRKHIRIHSLPEWYSYGIDNDFEIELPELPDVESMMKDYDDCFDFRGAFPGHGLVPLGEHERGGLNELLGDIPMDRVKSYSVKERKNGKRIVIDVENSPSIDQRKEMIIIKSGSKPKKVKMHKGRPIDSSDSTI
jgi:hypothetical protein